MKNLLIKSKDVIHNLNTVRDICGDSQIIAVLKGNGYGLGIVELAYLLEENGVTLFAVSELSEARTLRKSGFEGDILLLSSTSNMLDVGEIAKLNIIATVGSVRSAKVLNDTNIPIRAHIKIDTGFGRFGFAPSEINSIADTLKTFKNISYEGVFSHFSNSFGKDDKSVRTQFDLFMQGVDNLNKNGICPKIRHICNSCGALRFDFARLDAVRIGSALLGRLPIANVYGLKRVAHLQCEITEIKTIPAKHTVGYADTFKTKNETLIAVVPVGYKDGFGVEKIKDTFRFIDILRYVYEDLKNIGRKLCVTLNGKKVRIIGRISMYNIIIDITGIDAKIGDIVTLECNPILIESTVNRKYI